MGKKTQASLLRSWFTYHCC